MKRNPDDAPRASNRRVRPVDDAAVEAALQAAPQPAVKPATNRRVRGAAATASAPAEEISAASGKKTAGNRKLAKDLPASSSALPAPSGPGFFARLRASERLATGVSVLRSAFGVALAVGVAGGLAVVGHRYVTTSPRFALHDVHVTGGVVHDEASLLHLIGTETGKNLFSVDLAAGRRKLEADPWISKAELARTLPGTLDIRITERKAAALVACGESFLATREGELFKVVDETDKIDLPVVTGLDAETLTADRKGAEARVARALDAAAEYEHHPLAQRWTLEEIHVEPDDGVTLVVGKQAITLALGHAPWRKKLDEAFAIAGELDRRGKKPDVVMLDNDARPERVVVRMR
jgi:cell division protein FtsQ